MQARVGKGGEMGSCLAQPSLYRIRINFKHSAHRTDAQPFSHGGYGAYHPLGWARLAVKEGVGRLQKVRLTHDAVELSPGPTPWMAVRSEIALPGPAIISARFVGTVMMMGVNRSWAASPRSTQR